MLICKKSYFLDFFFKFNLFICFQLTKNSLNNANYFLNASYSIFSFIFLFKYFFNYLIILSLLHKKHKYQIFLINNQLLTLNINRF